MDSRRGFSGAGGRRLSSISILAILFSVFSLYFVVSQWEAARSPSHLYRKFWGRDWTEKDELRSLVHFAVTFPDKALTTLDIKGGLAPHTFGADSRESAKRWTDSIRATESASPVVIFSKTYCTFSKRAKALIEQYDITPKPLIIEVDLRDDGDIVKAELGRLTGRSTFPNILVHSESIGGSDDLAALHASGALRGVLVEAGVKVGGVV